MKNCPVSAKEEHSAHVRSIGSSACCTDSSRKEGPMIPLLHTHSVTEGAVQCCDSDLQGVVLLYQQ